MPLSDIAMSILGRGQEERDREFLREINEASRRGLGVIGLLGLLGTTFYVLIHVLMLGYDPGWSYPTVPTGRLILVMWDKIIIALAGLIAVLLARTTFGARHARSILAVCVLVAAAGMIVDEAVGGASEYFAGYLTLLMFGAVGAVPFRPSQAAAMCIVVFAMMFGLPPLLEALGPSTSPILGRQIVYWTVSSAVLTGIAHLVYRSRYSDYRNRLAIEQAEARLQEHNRELERSSDQLASEKRRTDEQAERLRQLEALKSRFFAGISHEFRTPITLILGPAKDVLDKHGAEIHPEVRDALGLIQRSGHRIHDLVDQLLDLSRLEAGKLPVHASRHDLSAFVEGVVSVFEAVAETRGIELVLENSVEDSEIWFDAEHLYKVFSNLLSNALKFTGESGRVRLRLTETTIDDDDAIEVSVKDSGVGIAAEDLEAIFDRFYRVERDGGAPAGSGIGLALVKELVELHGGTVSVTSEVGFGSEFIVCLRRGAEYLMAQGYELAAEQPPHLETIFHVDQAAKPDEPDIAAQEDESRPSVLVVEDNDDLRRYLRTILSPQYNVLEARNGREGLRTAAKRIPSLVITDVMMPEMSGIALCAQLKADKATRHIPVVMLTAKASREAVIEGLSSGADDYITKPFDATELIVRTENLIEIRKLLADQTPVFEHEPADVDEPSADEVFAGQVAESVEKHLGDANFTVDWLAEEVGISRRQLERRMRKLSRLTPAGFIRLMRLKRASQLLEKKVGTVSEVAYRVGFSDPNYFSRLFHHTFGVPPSEYPPDK